MVYVYFSNMSSQISDIGKSVVMCEGQHNTNIICIELAEGLVFVDSGRQDDIALEFREKMEKRFNKKATHLLLTHYHHDHISGMSAFKDIEIISSKTGHEKYLEDLKGSLSKEKRVEQVERWKVMAVERNWEPSPSRDLLWKYYPKVDLFPPTKAIDNIEIGTGKQKVIFKRVGGHTECSAYVYIPHEEIVILGDNIVADPSRVGGCFFGGLKENIVDVYNEIVKLTPKIIIPGHGPKTNLAYLERARDYYKKLFKILNEIFDKGIKLTEIYTYKGMPEFYDEKPDYWDNIVLKRLYLEIGAEKTIKEIDELLNKLNEASFENNVDKLIEFYSKDFVITVSDGFYVQGEEDFRRRFQPSNIVDISFERNDHYFIGDKFIEKISFKTKTKIDGKEKTTESQAIHIWIKEDGLWKLNTEIRLD
ncbi:MAG: MBL fold metallo-hydrolase [Candidatus Heimdallarchaeota archaeon]|nr:MBL fold metallo-hydrolase [Candidatus Heimdallarchaeota archaeon]